MKKTTRIMSLLLTLAMILTLAVPMTVSASFTDVDTNHNYYEAINNLSAEGILNGFEDGSFKPGDPVTRAQFTKIICYARSVGSITHSPAERSIFTDVAPEHWAANNIVTAYKQGIINGMGDGTFAPEANVNYEQAVKMVVCALGYEQRALSLGGYPYGYLSVANSKKIISGIVDCKIGEAMNRGAVAKLIDNMRNTEQYVEDGEASGSIRDEVPAAKKVNGRVIAGYGVALYDGENPCYKNQIELDIDGDNLFIISEIEDFDINDYLGRNVTVHYETEEGSSDKIVTSISLQSKKNEVTTINLDKIVSYDSSSIEYYIDADKDETEVVYYSSPDVLFNGEYTDSDVDDLLDDNYTKSGNITLISSDATGTADAVFIKAYELLVVSHIDKTNKKIYAKNTSAIVADTEDKSKNVTITKGGKAYSFTSLKQNEILSVAESISGNVIEILVSNKSTATGTIIATEDNGMKITLDSGSKTYTLLNDVYIIDGTKEVTKEAIVVGKRISAYIDSFGNVAMVIFTEEKAFEYGYLSAIKYKEMDAEMSARIYKAAASNSTIKEYDFADRIKVNGETMDLDGDISDIVSILEKDAIASKPAGRPSENDTYAQPIRFTVNTLGEINAITTVSGTSDNDASKLKMVKYSESGIECTRSGRTLGDYTISSETKIIQVPENRTKGTYYTKTNSHFKKDKSYYVQIVNTTSTKVAKCIYLYGEVGGGSGDVSEQITEETMPMIVKAISGVNVDNSDKKFTLLNVATGAVTECYDNDVAETEKLSVGDVVRIATTQRFVQDDNGKETGYPFIEDLQILADAEKVVAKTYSPFIKEEGEGSGIDYDFRTLIGTVTVKGEVDFLIVPGYSTVGTEENYNYSSVKNIYLVDTTQTKQENIVSEASSVDFGGYGVPGISSTIMIYTKDAQVKSIIIFK